MSATSQRRSAKAGHLPAENIDGRTARARATRARIISAATALFTTAGYTATSIGTIAANARVSEQTVYYAFGTKRAVLTVALDQAVAGDDEPVPTLERPWAREALAAADPGEQIQRHVAAAADIYLRAAALLDVVRSAAAVEPELAEVWATNLEQRRTIARVFAQTLADKTALREAMSIDTAADIILTVLAPETYRLLVNDCGWEHPRWQQWTTDALCRLLITSP